MIVRLSPRIVAPRVQVGVIDDPANVDITPSKRKAISLT
jgi:hypothetical protein